MRKSKPGKRPPKRWSFSYVPPPTSDRHGSFPCNSLIQDRSLLPGKLSLTASTLIVVIIWHRVLKSFSRLSALSLLQMIRSPSVHRAFSSPLPLSGSVAMILPVNSDTASSFCFPAQCWLMEILQLFKFLFFLIF